MVVNIMSYRNTIPRYTVMVDKIASHGDTTSVKTACDQLSVLTLNSTTFGRVMVNSNGQYAESPFTIPNYVEVRGTHGIDRDFGVGAWIIRNNPAASDTAFITMGTSAALTYMTVSVSGLPANFNTSYKLISTSNTVIIDHCRIAINTYNGANPAYAVYSNAASNQFLNLTANWISATGTGVTCVYTSTDMIMRNTTIGPACPIGVNLQGSSGRDTLIDSCYFSELAGNTYFINTAAGQEIRILNTRVPFNKRGGSTLVYEEYHPTPRQLGIALVKNSVNKAANYVIDENADGTVEATAAITVFMPATIANVDVGQAFCIVNKSAGAVTVDGNGVNINGAATYPLAALYDKVIIQKNASNTWSVIGS